MQQNTIVRVAGKRFYCEYCGASVFSKFGNRYLCNGCDAVYEGEGMRLMRPMPEDVVAHGFLTLHKDTPFGNNILHFRLGEHLYEVEAKHDPVIKDGKASEEWRMLEIKVKRIG